HSAPLPTSARTSKTWMPMARTRARSDTTPIRSHVRSCRSDAVRSSERDQPWSRHRRLLFFRILLAEELHFLIACLYATHPPLPLVQHSSRRRRGVLCLDLPAREDGKRHP